MAPDQANLTNTKLLRELADAVTQLPGYISRVLDDIEADAGPRLRRIERAEQEAREEFRRAERAYHSASEEDESDARAAMDEARERVVHIEHSIERVQSSLRKYKSVARDLGDARRGLLAGAAAYLSERLQAIDTYLAIQLDDSAAISHSGYVPGASQAVIDNADGIPVELMAGTSLPPGFVWIPISEIVECDLPGSPLEWKKGISKEDMRIGLSTFRRDMLPTLARDGHLTRDDCVNLDRDLGRASRGVIEPNSLAHLYDGFFGADSIAIDRNPGGGLSITNGRHRISVARDLGWTHVPGRLLGGGSL